MSRFEWTPDLETGHPDIDDQHKGLFELANTLDAALTAQSSDAEAIGDAIWGLTDYVVQHFADEEALMRESGYPKARAHKMLHERLTGETLRLSADYFNGQRIAAERIAPFVTSWLQEHILAEDVVLVSHVKNAEE
jgi:hemerythrin-like metal-binding protein